MLFSIALGLALVLTTLSIHFVVLRWTTILQPHCGQPGPNRVLVMVTGAFGAHLVEILLYATAYFVLESVLEVGDIHGPHERTVMGYLYYSIVMYTSLGLGDLFPAGHLRFISAIETLNGLVLIGWTTSFTFLAMRRYWPLDAPRAR